MRESPAKCVRLGRSVVGVTVVGRDPAFIQPLFNLWTHGFFTSILLKKAVQSVDI